MTIWPQEWFELYHDVLRRPGVHYTLKEGRSSDRAIHKQSLLVKPFYKGYTVRFFFFAGKKEGETFAGVRYDGHETWKARVIVKDGVASTDGHGTITEVGKVNVGDIYTTAVGTEDQVNFIMSFNEKGFNKVDFKDITDQWDYLLWESSGNHSILSMHFYNASNSFQAPHLGHRLYLNEFTLPVGAYATYYIRYDGTNEAVTVSAKQHPHDLNFTFEANIVKQNKEFYCIARITAYGLALSVSFEDVPRFLPAVGTQVWLRLCFDHCSILNAHIVSPW